jgi:hypothetical protein
MEHIDAHMLVVRLLSRVEKLTLDKLKLLSQEGKRIDFKRELIFTEANKKELAKDICAMANTEGGIIFVGIEDKTHELIGIQKPLDEVRIQQIACSRVYPSVNVFCQNVSLPDLKCITTICVPPSTEVHHVIETNRCYVREEGWKEGRKEGWTREASPIEIARMMQRKGIFPIETMTSKEIESWLQLPYIRERLPPKESYNAFMFGNGSMSYRRIEKLDEFAPVAMCPVFLPGFDAFSFPPEFGDKSAIYVRKNLQFDTLEKFSDFLVKVEEAFMSELSPFSYEPFYWTLSDNNFMMYGCGSANLITALQDHGYGTLGAVSQGWFGGKICFVVVYSYWKGGALHDTSMDLYMGSLPTDWNRINEFYKFAISSAGEEGTGISTFTTRELPFIEWVPVRHDFVSILPIRGGLRKKVRVDTFAGAIVDNRSFQKIEFRMRKSWHDEYIRRFKCPVHQLSESVLSLTNPIPYTDELKGIKEIAPPFVRMLVFYGGGFSVYGINVHSIGWR